MQKFMLGGKTLDFSTDDFSRWALSDLVSNVARSILAEYIVAKALRIENVSRVEWNAYDLKYKRLKIEVKSTAYIQTWNSDKYSKPQFSIGKRKGWFADTNTVGELRRHADVYVFCVFACQDWKTVDPLNLDQWEFYVVSTKDFDRKLPDQKTIGLQSLIRIFNLSPLGFINIKKAIDQTVR